MRRYFGPWGIELSDDEFAQALAALGVLQAVRGLNGWPHSEIQSILRQALQGASYERRGELRPLRWLLTDRPQNLHRYRALPGVLAEAWRAMLAERRLSRPAQRAMLPSAAFPRLALTVSWAWNPSRARLRKLLPKAVDWLSRPSVEAASAFIQIEQQEPAHEFDRWPLRLGFLPGSREDALRAELDATQRSIPLYKTVRLAEGRARCGLLILPRNLREAVASVISAPRGPVADAILVLGEAEAPGASADALVRTLLESCQSHAVVIARGQIEDITYVHKLIDELAHNAPLDVAAFAAGPPPYVYGDPRFFSAARLSSRLRGMSERLKSSSFAEKMVSENLPGLEAAMPEGPLTFKELGEQLASAAPNLDWSHESNAASGLAILEDLARAESTAAAREAPPRYLRASVLPAEGWGTQSPVEALLPARSYRAEVSVGPGTEDTLRLNEPFPSFDDELPDGEGRLLQVIFFDPRLLQEPLSAQLRLPPTGPSSACSFHFFTREGVEALEARITVMHRNRVLQTGVLRGRIDGQSRISFQPDARARTRLQSLGARSYFDGAIIVNHNDAGEPVATAVSDNLAARIKLDDNAIRDLTLTLNVKISAIASKPDDYRELTSAGNTELLRELARLGSNFHEVLAKHSIIGPRFHERGPVQIVTARYGGFLPIELAYRFPRPHPNASLCPHAAEGLEHGGCPEPCREGGTKDRVCPLGFWSVSRVIERHAHIPQHVDLKSDYELRAEPIGPRPVLPRPSAAVMAGSPRANEVNPNALVDLQSELTRLFRDKVYVASSWEEWTANVNKPERPMLLVLLPHHTVQPVAIELLELSPGDGLQSADVEPGHVVGEPPSAPPHPVVLLLGCETQFSRVAFDSFAASFQNKGAALVVATIATVLGRDAAPAAAELARELVAHAQGEHTFGEVLLRARRKLLQKGLVMALALTAYGDADWMLTET